ncbi:TolC family protein [Catenovulum maritimum]|uniref:RND transporter n=1 Tax=Catenovulum maritimum TaxID=1513271 RepID=A0A0J8H0P1_9ALTE|nr:TolC family protein [Catenovulum maritimum]KMT66583.1 hypothetical protein XM47_03365 [Catenovulum maritimum]
MRFIQVGVQALGLLFFCTSCSLKHESEVLDKLNLPENWGQAASANDLADIARDSDEDKAYFIEEFNWVKSLFGQNFHHLTKQAITSNINLNKQYYSIQQSKLSLTSENSKYLPVLNSNFEFHRNKDRTNLKLGAASAMPLDVWGKLGDQVKQKQFTYWQNIIRYQSQQFDLAMQFSKLHLQVIQSTKLQNLLFEKVDIAARKLNSLEKQYKRGLVNLSAVYGARNAYRSAEANLLKEQNQLAQLNRNISIIFGDYPQLHEDILSEFKLDDSLPELPKVLPAQLLEQRADLRLAWLNILNQQTNVAIQYKNRFPSFSLTLDTEESSDELSKLVKFGDITWNLKAKVFAPIFAAGRYKRAQQSAEIELDKVELNYLITAYNAFLQVENSLSKKQLTEYEIDTAEILWANSQQALRLAENRYHQGLGNYATYLNAQNALIDNEIKLIKAKFNHITQYLNLYSALGGDWFDSAQAPESSNNNSKGS